MSYGTNGSVIGPDNVPTASAASGLWSLGEVAEALRDGIWPAPIADYEAIATFQDASFAATISFTSIPATYTILKIVVYSNRYSADHTTEVNFATGGGATDTTDSNYGSQTYLMANFGSTGSSSLTQTTSSWRKYPGESFPNYSATNYPSVGMYTFPAYSSAVATKPSWFMGSSRDTQTNSSVASADGGPLKAYYSWDNTGAIDRIDLVTSGNSFNGYTVTLFGLAP